MNYLNEQDQQQVDLARAKIEKLGKWLMNNVMHPDFTKKARERNVLFQKIYRIKQAADPHKPKVVDTANIIIHPLKQF